MSIKLNGSYGGLKMKIVTLAMAVAITGGAAFAPVVAIADTMTIAQLQAFLQPDSLVLCLERLSLPVQPERPALQQRLEQPVQLELP